jgi:hypothetical protein
MGKLPERSSKHEEECGRHHQSQFVHRKVVMDSMQ